jgi:uncharacterized protein (TIGR02284 family)
MNATLERQRVVAWLNRCIEACVDAERAYGIAAATARDPNLKALFQSREGERAEFVMGLQRAVAELGAFPENQGTARGALRRRWMDLERGLEPVHDDRHVIASVLREERAAMAAYDATLPELEDMPLDVRVMLREQRSAMEIAAGELSRRTAA